MNVRDLHFGDPNAVFFVLGALFIAVLLYSLYRYRRNALQRLASLELLKSIALPRSPALSFAHALALCLAWIFAVVALMEPLGAPRYRGENADAEARTLGEKLIEGPGTDATQGVVKRRKAHEVIFLLDTSASMTVADTRTGVTRLNYAKEIIDEVVSELDGQSTALYAFTSQVHTVSPLTVDYLFVRLILKMVGVNEGDVAGTDLAEALETVRRKHFQRNRDRLITLVLLTDGGDTRLENLRGNERAREMQTIISRLRGAEELNLRVYTIGIGSPQGALIPDIHFDGKPVTSSLDEELLRDLANEGRGRYYFANDYSALGIAQNIVKLLKDDDPYIEEEEEEASLIGVVERTEARDKEKDLIYDLYFQYPLGIALLCLGLAIIMPETNQRREDL